MAELDQSDAWPLKTVALEMVESATLQLSSTFGDTYGEVL